MPKLFDALKSKNRTKISDAVQGEVGSARGWLQENGEFALFVGILAGVVFVLFFRILILFIVLGGLASYVIWQLSNDDSVSTQDVEFDIPEADEGPSAAVGSNGSSPAATDSANSEQNKPSE